MISQKLCEKIKRIFDIFFSTILILIFSPIVVIFILLIYLEDKSFPFYIQKRIGYKGKVFSMIKLRTMTNKKITLKYNKYYCFEDDPRITSLGKFLRKYSLDELPQFLNVFIGDMSLVGPRPAIFDEFDYEDIDQSNINVLEDRIKVKPGITGFSQVKSRNDITWNEKLKLDKVYLSFSPIKRLFFDFFILVLTFREIVFSKGVYDKRI